MFWPKDRIKNLLQSDTTDIEINLANLGLFNEEVAEVVTLLAEFPNKKISLNLFCNNIRDEGAHSLSQLNNVHCIDLTYNNIHDDGLIAIIMNPSFKYVELDRCSVTDACVDKVLNNFKGFDLRVYHNTGISEDSIKKINCLCRDNYNKHQLVNNPTSVNATISETTSITLLVNYLPAP